MIPKSCVRERCYGVKEDRMAFKRRDPSVTGRIKLPWAPTDPCNLDRTVQELMLVTEPIEQSGERQGGKQTDHSHHPVLP
jgi:hypothetical protein